MSNSVSGRGLRGAVRLPGLVEARPAREVGTGGRKRRQKQEFRRLIGLEDRRQAGMVLLYSACLF